MKVLAIIICVALVAAGIWFVDDTIAPLFLNSRIERIAEAGLPKAFEEAGGIIHCRMKADDFRFPIPPHSRVVNPIVVSGGFDTVHGSVRVEVEKPFEVSAYAYENSLAGKIQEGGRITTELIPDGLLIKFDYFGDK
jgi:hypothetical protein